MDRRARELHRTNPTSIKPEFVAAASDCALQQAGTALGFTCVALPALVKTPEVKSINGAEMTRM
eukprot:4984728-Pleurochrysis_carterae.AAC.1